MAAPPLPELVLTEGDEEVQYVLVEVPASFADNLSPGTNIQLEDLESDQPTLRLANGTVLQGEYEEPLGSVLFYERTASPDVPSERGATPPPPGPSGAPGPAVPPPTSASVQYRGTCESKLVFRMPSWQQQLQQQKGRGAEARGQGAKAGGVSGT